MHTKVAGLPDFQNLLVVSGSGRERGKTVLICNIISEWKELFQVVAVKISAHKHEHRDTFRQMHSGDGFSIWEELTVSEKDSGRFLSAGAKSVFYLEASDDVVSRAFHFLEQVVNPNSLIICESGSLGRYVNPGVMLFVQQKNERITEEKAQLKKLSHKTIYTDSWEISSPATFLSVKERAWHLI
jgi:hypothetical protein